jgi:hypothetical protein
MGHIKETIEDEWEQAYQLGVKDGYNKAIRQLKLTIEKMGEKE